MNINKKFAALNNRDKTKNNQKICVYVPSTIHKNIPIDNSDYIEKTVSQFELLFGGCTVTSAAGAWHSDNKYITENVAIVYSYTNKKTAKKNIKNIYAIAKELCIAMDQDAVSVEINNQIFFIKQQ